MSEADKVFAGSIPENYDRHMVPLIFESYARDLAQRVAALEFDEFEWAGANRPGPHYLLRNMAGIDGRKRARQQHR